DDRARDVGYGRRLTGVTLPGEPTALFGPDGTFLALYRPESGDAVPAVVFVG
ncbi:MAG TPA: tRNA pseudouridine(55) synthase TruB, partial [Microlunatus sp.]|nr:tRNA pseudouridine(55) synthase TruB [Microlunatus sp.]